MDRIKTLFNSISTRGKLALGGAVMAFVVFALIIFKIAGAPAYTPVATGVDPSETGKITAALDSKGVAYELRNNGTAVAVQKSQMADARIALAEQGLPGNSKPGYELFDKSKLGASDFQQKVTYQRALEGEVARTLGDVQGVNGVQVQLTMPDDKLFVDEQRKATAAVLLSGSTDIEPSAVKGMANLVASSVEGLKTSDVTITNESGQLLWPSSGSSGGGGSKQAVEARYDRDLEAKLNALVIGAVGPGKGQVQVNSDVDADRASQDELKYGPKKGVALTDKGEAEKLNGAGAAGAASGTAGTTGNQAPSYAAGGGAGGANSKYNRKSADNQLGVDKTVTHRKIAPGAVKKQSVSLMLDSSVSAADAAELRRAVTAASGIDKKRGDTLALTQVKFSQPKVVKPSAAASYMGYVKYLVLGLMTLIFLFLLTRHLRRRENEELTGEPAWLREINTPATLAQLEAGMPGHTAQLAAVSANPDREAVEGADPERVANQVRAWMKD